VTTQQFKVSETPLSLAGQIVLWFVAVNALLGAGSLLLFPARTDALFFWTITPPINAALFGALYLSGAIATAQAALRGRWETARFLVPVLVSAGFLLTLVTLLHLDRFDPGIKLIYWLAVYIVAPLLAIGLYIQHERRGAAWGVTGRPISPLVRILAAFTALAITVVALVGLAAPGALGAVSPWPLPPLMARVFAAWFAAFVPGLLWFLIEPDWSRLYPVANLFILSAAVNLVVIVMHRQDILGGPALFALALLGALAAGSLGVLMHLLQWLSAPRQAVAAERQPLN
jgi:hypothetical protein